MVLGIVKGKARQEACCHFQRLRPCRNDRFFGITGVETRRKQALELLTSTRTPRIQHYLASHSIYMCVYIYIYVHKHTYIHTYTQTHGSCIILHLLMSVGSKLGSGALATPGRLGGSGRSTCTVGFGIPPQCDDTNRKASTCLC